MSKGDQLRDQLVKLSLEWEECFNVAPSITTAVSELDASRLVGMSEVDYCTDCKTHTAVTKDIDFTFNDIHYQVTANRPSGKKGSKVTLVNRKTEGKRPFGWDRLIWILYDRFYVMQEAWEFTADQYRKNFGTATRLSPDDMRKGRRIFPRENH